MKRVCTDKDLKLITTARDMIPRIRALSSEIDQLRGLPSQLKRDLADAGFFKMLVARNLGGLETDFGTATQVVETLSRANGAVGWVVMIAAGTSFWAATSMDATGAREMFLPDAQITMVGTVLPIGKAVRTDGGYQLTGRWAFGSGCGQADYIASGAWLFDGDEPIIDESGHQAWGVFVTPAADCTIIDTWTVTGLRGTGSHDYTIDDIFVPDRRMFKFVTQPIARSKKRETYLAAVAPMMPAVSLGIARAAVDRLKEIIKPKIDGQYPPLAGDIDKHVALANAHVLVSSARMYLYDTLEQVWTTMMTGEPVTMELRGRLRAACTHAVQTSVKAVDLTYAAAGGTAIYTSCELERHFRDIHTAAAHFQMRPATMVDAGSLLLGIEPEISFF